jgi:microcystin-dependent protein
MPFSVFNAAGAALNQSLTDTPVGSIQPFAGASAPGGWLLCDGAAVSRTDYAELFAVLGTTYGTGNGSTTFNVPDLRGRVPAGLDNMGGSAASRLTNTVLSASNTMGATGGAQTHTLTTAQLPAHNHAPKGDGTSFYVGVPSGGDVINGGGASYRFNFGTSYTTTGNTGSDNAHTNTQPTLVVTYIILASSLATRLQAAALPQYVTSLPASPVDGQTVVYAADASNGVMWTLRYRAAATGSYKWEFVGGSALRSMVKDASIADNESTNSTTYTALTTAGPTITLPLAGDYEVTTGFTGYNTVQGAISTMSYDIGATGAVDADGVQTYAPAFSTGGSYTGAVVAANSRTRIKTSLSAVTLTAKYKSSSASASSANFFNRFMVARPVRVG